MRSAQNTMGTRQQSPTLGAHAHVHAHQRPRPWVLCGHGCDIISMGGHGCDSIGHGFLIIMGGHGFDIIVHG